jgi:cytochrome b561
LRGSVHSLDAGVRRYSAVAVAMHWLIAALILANIGVGLRMESVHGLAKFNSFQLHKSFGITILVLSLLRLAWRIANPPPPAAAGLSRWEKTASTAVHWAFYVIMIGMPLIGWLSVSASPLGLPTLLYRIGGFPGIPWPHLPIVPELPLDQRKAIEAGANGVHATLAWIAIGLIVLHVAAALKHQFFDRDPVLPRMIPFLKQG